MRHARITDLLPVLLLAVGACAGAADPVRSDIDRALDLAVAAVSAKRPEGAGESVVTGARQEIRNGKYVWLITFELAHLLPEDPSEGLVGLGGETFATVETETGDVVLTYGE